MAAETWKEKLVGYLYEELDPETEREVERELAERPELRAELEDLRSARSILAEGEPAMPVATPKVMVLSPRPLRRPLLAFAAGFACAAGILAIGLAVGWNFAVERIVPAPGGTPVAAGQVSMDEIQQALSTYQANLDRVQNENQELRSMVERQSAVPVLTQDQFREQLSEFGRTLDMQRASDLSYILGEMVDLQEYNETRIGATQDALRYFILATDPTVSEQ